jgi:hypothetical protein
MLQHRAESLESDSFRIIKTTMPGIVVFAVDAIVIHFMTYVHDPVQVDRSLIEALGH